MSIINEILNYIYSFAPPSLAEDWDNIGLLVGDGSSNVCKALIALDITSAVVNEASEKGAQLIISHHPVIFHPINAVTSDGGGKNVLKLAQNNISAICMHTNLDMCNNGVNDALAEALELKDINILKPELRIDYKKIVVFAPRGYVEQIRSAMTEAGAGKLGNYDSCVFTANGEGFFRPLKGSNPFLGSQGVVEQFDETRIEMLCSPALLENVISAMIKAHPYEMPAYDIFNNESVKETYGLGRTGKLKTSIPLDDFASFVKQKLNCSGVMLCDCGKAVSHVAVCGGSDDGSLAQAAVKSGADTLVVGEMKHSMQIEALESGINVIIAGHFETENVICSKLLNILSYRFTDVKFEVAKANKSPFTKQI